MNYTTEEEKLLFKFKDYRVMPSDVMLAIRKLKSKLHLDEKTQNEQSYKIARQGLLVLQVGKTIDFLHIGEKVFLSPHFNVEAETFLRDLDEDYNIIITSSYNIKLVFPENYIPEEIKKQLN